MTSCLVNKPYFRQANNNTCQDALVIISNRRTLHGVLKCNKYKMSRLILHVNFVIRWYISCLYYLIAQCLLAPVRVLIYMDKSQTFEIYSSKRNLFLRVESLRHCDILTVWWRGIWATLVENLIKMLWGSTWELGALGFARYILEVTTVTQLKFPIFLVTFITDDECSPPLIRSLGYLSVDPRVFSRLLSW